MVVSSGAANQSNKEIIQRFQNKVLRNIVNVPWYIRNSNLHRDLGIESIDEITKRYARSHENRLCKHVNVEAIQLLEGGVKSQG